MIEHISLAFDLFEPAETFQHTSCMWRDLDAGADLL